MAKNKITVFKKVYWKNAGKDLSGKVKQVMLDHVVVKSDDGEYIVRKDALTLSPEKKS